MGWFMRKVTNPFKRMWSAVHSVVLLRLRPHKRGKGKIRNRRPEQDSPGASELAVKWSSGQGLGKLYNEVRSCHYEDVQVMWSMLQQSHHPLGSPKRRRITRSFQ
ncbi:unnamed protein product [Sphagnum troendelagicum]|uniref:Uncharacterized protein n=1 Tax=Sphagnum troendelagicum TaxID=128251 RepID=A0ABP0V3L3_9BRYO